MLAVALTMLIGGTWIGYSYAAMVKQKVIDEQEGQIKGFSEIQATIPTEHSCPTDNLDRVEQVINELECSTRERAEELQASKLLNHRIMGRICEETLAAK
ncbi:MAG: hypothetical protein C9356_15630 [Oleiphilus sp.]|nr:MAG: hypothetical protein C9356_15630 [Oleiphilus sp.]